MRAGGNIGVFDCNWFLGSLPAQENDVGDCLRGSIAAITHNIGIVVDSKHRSGSWTTSFRIVEVLEQHSGETKDSAIFEFRFGIQCYVVER